MESSDTDGSLSGKLREAGSLSFRFVLDWIGSHVRGFHAAIGAFLALGLGLAALAALLFTLVAGLVAIGATSRFDRVVMEAFAARASPRLDGLALEVTALGSAYVTAVIAVIASIFLWQSRHRYSAALIWVALAGGWVLNRMLKDLFERDRPDPVDWRVPYAGEFSYPSGHSTTAMVLYATVAYLVVRLEPRGITRKLTILFFSLLVLGVGLSRIYLGVHFPSDVIGGFLVGFAWASICALGIEAIRYFRTRRPEVARDERDLDRRLIDEAPTGKE